MRYNKTKKYFSHRGSQGRSNGIGRFVLLVFAFLICGGQAFAQGNQAPQVTVTPQKNAVALGEAFWIEVRVSGQAQNFSVSLPPNSPFQVLGRSRSSFQSSFQFGFGSQKQVTSSQTFQIHIRATKAGNLDIGPLVISDGRNQYRAGQAKINVIDGGGGISNLPPSTLSGKQIPGQSLQQQHSQSQEIPGQIDPGQLKGAVYDNELFLRTVVEPEKAYVGQQVVMTIYIYTALDLSNVGIEQEATTDGFWIEELFRPKGRIRFEDQFVGQRRFRVAKFRRFALFPLKSGSLTIGAPRINASTGFRSIFSRRSPTLVRSGVPVNVVVSELPEKGRPRGFSDGNVGSYKIRARVDRTSVKVGEAVNLTVTVSGEGNTKKIVLPELEQIDGTKMYEPTTHDTMVKQGDKIVGEKKWDYLILPQKTGTVEIPSIELDYFDPIKAEYLVAKTRPLTIKVSPGGKKRATAQDDPYETQEVTPNTKSAGTLRSIHRNSELASSPSEGQNAWWFWLILFLAPAGFLTLVIVGKVRDHRIATQDVTAARKAASKAKKALRAAREEEGGIREIMKAINIFFDERFGKAISGFTQVELRAYAEELGADEALTQELLEVNDECERSRFAGGSIGREEVDRIAQKAEVVLVEFDKLSSKGKGNKK